MRLNDTAFEAVTEAMFDAFGDIAELRRVARCVDWRLQEITSLTNPLQTAVEDLIEYAETRDKVVDLMKCAKSQNSSNSKLASLDIDALSAAQSTEEIVAAASGSESFKVRLVEALASVDDAGMQLVAARDLMDLFAESSDEEADTLYLALLGRLKTAIPDPILGELSPVLASYLRRRIGAAKRPDTVSVDLARARLRRIDLSGLDLHGADIAFADLRYANLEGSNLWRSRGYAVDVRKAALSRSNLEEARWHRALAGGAKFHDCRMVSVNMKEADLSGAEFHGSRLQGAHFERADLTGAHFQRANIADAYFLEARIDDVAARSISRALNWHLARFDTATRNNLQLTSE
jgi:uncharacterized protein YjbI with pentapeptide repeats